MSLFNTENLEGTVSPRASGTIRNDSYQNAMADLTREQWNNFQTRYLPTQNTLLSLANSDQLLTEQLDRNKVNIENSFETAKQGESIRMGRFGLAPDDSTQDGNNNNLLKNLTKASVNNETRSAVDDLQNKIITGQGGAPKSLADIGGQG
jgi:basic membrane lipoprotein Med (substrate-binding protein (PBP1-ABC) superfamily)